MIQIGKIIKKELDNSGMKVGHFADSIGKTRSNVYDIFNRNTIDTELLERISKVLGYDFFKYYTDNDDSKGIVREKNPIYNVPKKKTSKISLLIEIDPDDEILMNKAFAIKLRELMKVVSQ